MWHFLLSSPDQLRWLFKVLSKKNWFEIAFVQRWLHKGRVSMFTIFCRLWIRELWDDCKLVISTGYKSAARCGCCYEWLSAPHGHSEVQSVTSVFPKKAELVFYRKRGRQWVFFFLQFFGCWRYRSRNRIAPTAKNRLYHWFNEHSLCIFSCCIT